jgi:hypothetical protein
MTVHKIGAPRWTAKLPQCPWCRKEVDPTGDLHAVAWVKGVLWHAACLDDQLTQEDEARS